MGVEGFEKVARFEAAELDEVRAAAEVLADVVAVGADVEAFAALDAEFDEGQRDFVDDVAS